MIKKILKKILGALVLILAVTNVYAVYDHLEVKVDPLTTPKGSLTDVTQSIGFSIKVTALHTDGTKVITGDGAYTQVKFTCSGGLTIANKNLSSGEVTVANVIFNNPGNQTIEVSDVYDPTINHGFLNLTVHRYVDNFVVSAVSPVTAGTPFNLSITAQDNTAAIATTFNDDVTLKANIGDLSPVTISKADFIGGIANVAIRLYGADPINRQNAVTVTNTVTYPGQASAPKGVSNSLTVNPLAYQRVMLLFPGETLTPGTNPGKNGTPNPNLSGAYFEDDGLTDKRIKVIAVDQYWNPVLGNPNAPISFASDIGTDILPANMTMTSNTKIFTGNTVGEVVRFLWAGQHTITVTESINSSNSVSSVKIENAGIYEFWFEPGTLANRIPDQVTTTPFALKVTARDAAGNIVVNYNGTQTLAPSTGAGTIDADPSDITPQDVITFTNGVWNGSVRMTKKASGGAYISIDDLAGHTGRTQGTVVNGLNFDFRVVPGAFNKFLVLMGETYTPGIYPGYSGGPAPVDVGQQVIATVRAIDDFWNVVSGPSVQVPVTISCPSGYFEIEPADQGKTLPATGEDTFRVKFRTHGSQRIVAIDPGAHTGTSNDIMVHSLAYTNLVLVAPGETLDPGVPPSIDPDGKSGAPTIQTAGENFTVSVVAVDSYWNPIENPPYPKIGFTSSDGSPGFPTGNPNIQMGTADQNFLLSLGTLGYQTLTVTDQAAPAKTNTVSIQIIPGAVHHYALSAISSPQNAGVSFNLTIQAQDQFNNLTSTDVLVNLNSSTGAGTFIPSAIQLIGGVGTSAVTVYKADPAVILTAIDVYGRKGVSNSFKVSAGGYKKLVLLLPGQSAAPGIAPGKTGIPVPSTVGLGVPMSVQACDEWWNPVAIIKSIKLSSDNFALFTAGENLTLNPQGTVFTDVVLKTAAAHTIKAEDSSNTTIYDTSTITGYAGVFARLQLVLPGETPQPGGNEPDGKVGAPTDQTAGVLFTPAVYAVDQFWNRISSVNGEMVHLKSSDGSLDLNPPLNQDGSFVNGKIAFDIFIGNSGLIDLTASNLSDPSKTLQTVSLTVRPGAVYEITVPSETVAGVPFMMKIRLVDSGTKNLVNANNSFTLKVFLTNGDAASGVLEVVTGVLSGGEATINSQVYNYVERIKIRITDPFNRLSYTEPINVVPGTLYYDFEVPAQAVVGPPTRFPVNIFLKEGNTRTLVKSMDRQVNIYIYSAVTGIEGEGDWPVHNVNLFQGKASFEQSYTKAENVYIVAKDTAGLNGVSAIFPMVADTYKKVQILAPGEESAAGTKSVTGKKGAALKQQVQIPFPVTVRAVDQFWNLVGNYNSGKVTLSSTDDKSLNETNPVNQGSSFVNGEIAFNISLINTGAIKVTAMDTNNLEKLPQDVVIPLSQVLYEIITPASVLSGPPPTFELTVRLKDADTGGNIPSSNSFTLTPLKPNLEPATGTLSVTNSNLNSGVVVITGQSYNVAEKIVIKIVDNMGRTAYSNVIDVQPEGVYYAVTVPKESRVGPPDTFAFNVQLRDKNTHNVVPQINRKITIEPYFSATGLLAAGSLGVSSAQLTKGETIINQSFTKVGAVYFRVYDETGADALSNIINFLPGAVAEVNIVAPPMMEAGETKDITVSLKDAYQNQVNGQTVNFIMMDNLAMLDSNALLSDALGNATLKFTAKLTANGQSRIKITLGQIEKIISIKILGAPVTSLVTNGVYNELPDNAYIKPSTLLSLNSETEIGLDKIYYRIDSGDWQIYTGPFTIKDVGVHRIEYYAVDSSTNIVHSEAVKASKILYVSREETGYNSLVNYPNPFRAGEEFTNIEYKLENDADVTITIYNLLGDLVWQESFLPGQKGGQGGEDIVNSIPWWGRNNNGITVGNGGYICQLENKTTGQKMRRKIAVRK
ncbi:MAG: hypothetical protein ABII74_04605 [Elusimicrobiota bacterium]